MKVRRLSTNFYRAIAAFAVSCLLVLPVGIAHAQTDGRGLHLKPAEQVSALPGAEKRWALIIGIDAYEDPQINGLEAASNDANALASALISHGGFFKDQAILPPSSGLPRNRPSRGNILRRLSNLQGVVPADGLLVVAFAGHG